MASDNLNVEEYFDWQRKCIEEMLRVSKGPVFYNIQMITGNKEALCMLLGYFHNKVKEIIIWDKIHGEPAMGERVLNSVYEFIIVFDKDAISRQFNVFNAPRGTLDNIIRVGKNHSRAGVKHNAVFPQRLPAILMENFTKEGDIILDPFMGVGTTAVVARKLNRNFLGFEINSTFCEYANSCAMREENLFNQNI